MTIIRAITATIIFLLGIFFLVKLFTAPFSWINLIIALICFALAYFIWPSKKQGQRHEDNWVLDVMEILIELPVEIIFWVFRMIGHLFRKSDGIDIDF
jgi:hypothetical protein